MKRNAFIVLLLVCSIASYANSVSYTRADSLVYESYIKKMKQHQDEPINELIVRTAKFFLGTPYVAATLDQNAEEQLVVNLRELDCTTFVESCIALSQDLKSEKHSFANFCNKLQAIRYRNGKVDGYASRLHYVSDWMNEYEQKKVLKNISQEIGGQFNKKELNFMSTHTSSYKALSGNTRLQEQIIEMETNLNTKGGYYFIEKNSINESQKLLKNGDIVVFSTSIAGLDFTHIGIVYVTNNATTFIHASSQAKKVIVEKETLNAYCQASKKCTGIVVLRLN